MAVQLSYGGEVEYNNTKGLIFNAAFTGNYGTNGVGDLLNMAPYELTSNPTGVLDPNSTYNFILGIPPGDYGILNQNLGGSYCNIKPNAVPTLANFGLQMYEPGGTEKATGAAYTAAELAGSVKIIVFVPRQ